jgi:hypothetical protein
MSGCDKIHESIYHSSRRGRRRRGRRRKIRIRIRRRK